MKALVICDDNLIFSKINDFLFSHQIDSINYSWFLKALDNLEEIQPDLIIINGEEFPRQWKILSQFLKSNLIKEKIPLFVFYNGNFDDEIQRQIAELKNITQIKSLDESELNKLLPEKNDDSEIILRSLVSSPKNKKIIAGNLVLKSFEDMKIKFIPDFDEDFDSFDEKSKIETGFYEYEMDCISYKTNVLKIDKENKQIQMEFIE